MSKVKVNWEKVAVGLAHDVQKSDEFNKFCTDRFNLLEDHFRAEIRRHFIDELDEFKPGEEDEMEFILTLEGDLMGAFWKKFVTEFLGREW